MPDPAPATGLCPPSAPVTTPPTITGTITADPALAVTPGDVREWGGAPDIDRVIPSATQWGALRAILGARENEPLADAARRVVAERDGRHATVTETQAKYSRVEQTHGAITGALRIDVLATRAEILAAIDRLTYDRDLAQRAMVRAQAVAEHERQRGDVIDRERATVRAALDLARDEAERLASERDDLVRFRDSMLAGARTTSQTIDAIRDALGVREDETIVEAAERVVRERDEALAGGAGGTFRAAWDALLAARGEGESIADVVPRLTRERDEAIIDRDEAAAAEVAALERCGYYERSSIARLLGITADQIEAVRAVLRAAAPGATLSLDSVQAHRLEMAARGWVAAGRPLARKEGVRGE